MTLKEFILQIGIKRVYRRDEAEKLTNQNPETFDSLVCKGIIQQKNAEFPLENILEYLSSSSTEPNPNEGSAVDRTGRIGPTNAGAPARTRGVGCRKESLGDRTPVSSTVKNQGQKKE